VEEKFVRTQDGRIIFQAIAAVGINNAVSTSMHGYLDNGFPRTSPSVVAPVNIWSAFSESARMTVAKQ
jgi:hypothetical protein